MHTTRRHLLCMLASLPLAARATEAAWPGRPLRMIVSGGPGSVTDVRARWLADRLGPALAQPMVVENKPGAGGSIGMAEAARAAPDGYTIALVHQGTMAINPHLYAKLGYDPLVDFAPITRLGIGGLLLSVPVDSPARSVADLLRLAKSKPGGTRYGTPGIGTPPHLASELFVRMAGIDATHVPYKGGGGQLVTDLMSGQLDWGIEGTTVHAPQVKAGRLRALAVTGAQRAAAMPDVPTLVEAGVPGYEFVGWTGLAMPAATSQAIVARLHQEIAKIVGSADGREYFASLGLDPGVLAPDVFAAFIRDEHAKWGKVIRDAGIRIE